MALNQRELYGSSVTRTPALRAAPYEDGIKPGKLSSIAGAPSLAKLIPLAFDAATNLWKVWSSALDAGVNEVQTLSANSATGGTFTITFDGQTTSALAYNASAATIDTAMEALSNIGAGNIAVTGGAANAAALVFTFGGTLAGKNVPVLTVNNASLTGGAGGAITVTTEGAGDAGKNEIAGFLWEDDFTASATEEKLVNIFRRGVVHYEDIPVPSGESATNLKAALKSGPRQMGLVIDGLPDVH